MFKSSSPVSSPSALFNFLTLASALDHSLSSFFIPSKFPPLYPGVRSPTSVKAPTLSCSASSSVSGIFVHVDAL